MLWNRFCEFFPSPSTLGRIRLPVRLLLLHTIELFGETVDMRNGLRHGGWLRINRDNQQPPSLHQHYAALRGRALAIVGGLPHRRQEVLLPADRHVVQVHFAIHDCVNECSRLWQSDGDPLLRADDGLALRGWPLRLDGKNRGTGDHLRREHPHVLLPQCTLVRRCHFRRDGLKPASVLRAARVHSPGQNAPCVLFSHT